MNFDSLHPESHSLSSQPEHLSPQAKARVPIHPIEIEANSNAEAVSCEAIPVGIAKASTLVIESESEQPPDTCPVPQVPLKYIQGVIQGNRAFIITNLLPGASCTIHQPQMVWTIGRNREAAIPLQDRAMSRRHAVLLFIPQAGFQLVDLNSMNGSFINGKRIFHRCFLRDGDRLRLGSTDVTFFASRHTRSVGALHAEVLARLNSDKSYSPQNSYMDYIELEEPDILFNRSVNTDT